MYQKVYLPLHKNSPNSLKNALKLFDDLSDEILNYDSDDYYHLICGDMNAHTQEFDDYVIFDEHMCEQLDIDSEIIVRLQVKETMDILNIHSQRISVDKYKDRGNYGKALLELCKNHGVCIYNGLIGADKELEKKLLQMELSLIMSLLHHWY